MVRFKNFVGKESWKKDGGMFVSNRLRLLDRFDYYLVLKVANYENFCGQSNPKYGATLTVVAPSQVDVVGRSKATDRWGANEQHLGELIEEYGDLAWVDILSQAGFEFTLWEEESNNLGKLMKDARRKARFLGVEMLPFMLSVPQDSGLTGYDILKGEEPARVVRSYDYG